MAGKRKAPRKRPETDPARLVSALLAWYDRGHRSFLWRAETGEPTDPYRVWLAEVMLQQTQAATVEPYFREFTARWPRLEDLAAAELDAVLHAWQGLGYYSRARNLHRAARLVRDEFAGRFPEDEAGLRQLPGIGPYSAAAIAAIAFGKPATVVDGNVERVIARLFAVTDPLPKAKVAIRELAATLTPAHRPGDYAHAIMELGGAVCRPANPACDACPWAFACEARKQGIATTLPKRQRKATRPTRHGIAFWLRRGDGAVLLRRRPERGLLGGMMEIPSTDWRPGAWTLAEALKETPLPPAKLCRQRLLPGTVRHEFSHFRLELQIVAAETRGRTRPLENAVWCRPERFGDYALPSAMRKLTRHVLEVESVALGRRA
ncbi:MAG: A/G-specific adenine glycosylase [Alphaproteobacteria bacterium]|nr:A/G-specific adenine glycosylase [Alphaproteobacteria bacterium]